MKSRACRLLFMRYSSPPAPEALACDLGALDQRVELRPDDALWHVERAHRTRKAAVDAGDDVFATDDAGEALDAVGDQLRVLHGGVRLRHDTGDQYGVRRQLDVLPQP